MFINPCIVRIMVIQVLIIKDLLFFNICLYIDAHSRWTYEHYVRHLLTWMEYILPVKNCAMEFFFCKRQYSRKLCIGEYYIEISKFAICTFKFFFFLRKTGNSCSNENVKYVNCVLAKLWKKIKKKIYMCILKVG